MNTRARSSISWNYSAWWVNEKRATTKDEKLVRHSTSWSSDLDVSDSTQLNHLCLILSDAMPKTVAVCGLSFIWWSVVFSSGQAAMAHKQQSLKATYRAQWRDEPQASAKGEKSERESHFSGFHGNVPAPDSSVIPQHWDMPLSWRKEERRRLRRDTKRKTEIRQKWVLTAI